MKSLCKKCGESTDTTEFIAVLSKVISSITIPIHQGTKTTTTFTLVNAYRAEFCQRCVNRFIYTRLRHWLGWFMIFVSLFLLLAAWDILGVVSYDKPDNPFTLTAVFLSAAFLCIAEVPLFLFFFSLRLFFSGRGGQHMVKEILEIINNLEPYRHSGGPKHSLYHLLERERHRFHLRAFTIREWDKMLRKNGFNDDGVYSAIPITLQEIARMYSEPIPIYRPFWRRTPPSRLGILLGIACSFVGILSAQLLWYLLAFAAIPFSWFFSWELKKEKAKKLRDGE